MQSNAELSGLDGGGCLPWGLCAVCGVCLLARTGRSQLRKSAPALNLALNQHPALPSRQTEVCVLHAVYGQPLYHGHQWFNQTSSNCNHPSTEAGWV